jgi:hypothetical protein
MTRLATLALLALYLTASPASAASFWGERVEVHGFVESTMRALSDDYQTNDWYLSQWSNVLNLEADLALAPDGWGPFDLVEGFARVEVRYDCIYSGCGVFDSYRHFGDRAQFAPARNWSDGTTSGLTGLLPNVDDPKESVQKGTRLLGILDSPLLRPLRDFGATNLDATFAPVADQVFTFKQTEGSLTSSSTMLGPWAPESVVRASRTLATVANHTLPLPMRPLVPDTSADADEAHGLFVPSERLRRELGDFDTMDLNFSENDLAWNHGASQQDEYELREAYLDLETLDGRLWLRLGKQNIVWGKTELFRTTDQFNPTDIALESLGSLEETRIPLWAARAIYSLYDVGPLEDVRLELAVNYDDFEPTDLGRCGEPYTPWLVCFKPLGATGHGLLGIGLAGEQRPEDPWDSVQGLEGGVRLEWRWERFSFALSDFWGYDDAPFVESLGFYERNVDPSTGRPRRVGATEPCLTGNEDSCLRPDNALRFHPVDRQYFDVVCSATVGVASVVTPALAERCLVDVINDNSIEITSAVIDPDNPTPITDPLNEATFSGFFSNLFVGNATAVQIAAAAFPGGQFVFLNQDECDGFPNDCMGTVPEPPANTAYETGGLTLNNLLTVQQQALIGCGPFYQTNCEVDGIDLFNAEGSVLVQSFPQIEGNAFGDGVPPVATRFVDGQLLILPGARGPGDPGYDPAVDGCVSPDLPACSFAHPLVNPSTGELFRSEMAAFSYNFMIFLAALSLPDADCLDDPNSPACDPEQGDPECTLTDPVRCGAQRAAIAVTGVQRPEVRAGGNGKFGRRDWVWSGGGEAVLRYDKRNVLGFSLDFAEDASKSNWSFEYTWIDDSTLASNTSRSLVQEADLHSLTISVDRPTFVNFLNPNRTLFFNSQWFLRWIEGHDSSFTLNGPLSVLATFSVFSGYFQDRMLPSLTYVHDFRSASGGVLASLTYRYTEALSATFGLASFFGGPENERIGMHQLAIQNNGGDFKARTGYEGLSPIAERDELFVSFRWTF